MMKRIIPAAITMAKSPTSHSDSKMQTQQQQAIQKKHYFFGNVPHILLGGMKRNNIKDDISHSTLLSDQGDDGSECGEDAQSTPNSDTARSTDLSRKWKAMEKRFSDRNRRFQRISDQTQNAELLSLLWERERAVRTLERECLLLRHGYSNNGNGQENLFYINDNDDSSSEPSNDSTDNESREDDEDELFYDAIADSLPETPSIPRPSLMSRLPFHRAAVLEFKTTVPTAINLVFDCLFYNSAFEIIDIVMRGIAQKISKAWMGKDDDGMLAFFPLFIWLLFSLVILWHSGYLFWWSSQEVYSCLKFDLHNQLKLKNSPCLRVMRFIREREVLCMSVYLVGYIICYTSVMMLNELLYNSLFQKQTNRTVLFYDLVTLTISMWVLKTYGFIKWKKF